MGMIARSFLIAMSVIALWMQTKDERLLMLERSVFWVAVGVTSYACGTLVILGLSNYLVELGRPYFIAGWSINWCLLIASNIFYTKGMLCKAQV
jgi:hypothetical protein